MSHNITVLNIFQTDMSIIGGLKLSSDPYILTMEGTEPIPEEIFTSSKIIVYTAHIAMKITWLFYLANTLSNILITLNKTYLNNDEICKKS